MSVVLEASRYTDVGDTLPPNSFVNSRCLQARAFRTARLIAGERRIVSPGAQDLGCLPQDLLDHGVIGHNKSSQQFGQASKTIPLVICKDFDGNAPLNEHLIGRPHMNIKVSSYGLRLCG